MPGGRKRKAESRIQTQWGCAACQEFHRHATTGAALRQGKQALTTAHRGLVEGDVECSLEFDSVFRPDYPNSDRVDYLLVRRHDCTLIAIEVHPASSTGNVDDLIQKKRVTKQLLEQEGFGVKVSQWHWVVSGQSTIAFSALDKYGLKLSRHGILQPCRKARLGK